MNAGERDLIRLSAALAARDKTAAAEAMQSALDTADPIAVEEAILQTYLFLGFPTCLNGFAMWRRLSGRPPEPAAPIDAEAWEIRGAEVCGAVYAGQYERLRDNIRALSADMERYMVIEGYGKVLGRPGLALDVRELCIVAVLAVIRMPKQLYSHLRGALNVGASRERIEGALRLAENHLDEDDIRLAWRTWEKVVGRAESGSEAL